MKTPPTILGPAAEALLQSALAQRQMAHAQMQQADAAYLAAIRALAEAYGLDKAELEIRFLLVQPAGAKGGTHADQ